MGLLKTIKKRLTNQFVGVLVYENTCIVKIRKVKNGQVLSDEEKEFDLHTKESLTKDIVLYLQTLQEEIEQTYISLFLNSHGQGIVPECSKSAYEKFHIEYNNVKEICVDHKYSVYASNIDIKWAEKLFTGIGLDFIFSPFLMLDNLRKKESRKQDGIVLYLLAGNNSITIMIFEKSKLLYGTFINIAKEEDLLTSDFSDDTEEDDDELLDEIDLDLELEESDEISEILEEVNDDMKTSIQEEDDSIKLKLFGQDLRLVKYFDASLREFYENDLYQSDFVTHVKIYDGAQLNQDIVSYLKEQLLVDIDVRTINIADELIALTIQEVESIA